MPRAVGRSPCPRRGAGTGLAARPAHHQELEERPDRGDPAVDRGRGGAARRAAAPPSPDAGARVPCQSTQANTSIGSTSASARSLLVEEPGEVGQVEGVRPDRGRRERPRP